MHIIVNEKIFRKSEESKLYSKIDEGKIAVSFVYRYLTRAQHCPGSDSLSISWMNEWMNKKSKPNG